MDPHMVALSGQGHVRSLGTRIERDLVAPWPTKLSLKKRLTPGYIAHWWTMVDAALASRDLLDHIVPAPTSHDEIRIANPTASAHEVNIVYNTAMTTRAVAQAHAARALFALTDHSEIGMSDTKKVQDWVAAGDGTSVYNYLISMTDTESYVLQMNIREAYRNVSVSATDSHVVLKEKLELKAYLFQLNTQFSLQDDAWQGAMDICQMMLSSCMAQTWAAHKMDRTVPTESSPSFSES